MFHCRHDSHISQQEEGNVDERQWPFEPAQHNYRKKRRMDFEVLLPRFTLSAAQ
jgi:hypothetical protein